MKHELTQELYTQVMALNPSQFSSCGSTCPVENISWMQAVTFANKLSRFQALEECYIIDELNVSWDKGIECLGWRLPTEAEWEFAARGTKGQSEGRFAKNKSSPEQRSDRNVWVYAGEIRQVSLPGMEVLIQTIQTIWDVKLVLDKEVLTQYVRKPQ